MRTFRSFFALFFAVILLCTTTVSLAEIKGYPTAEEALDAGLQLNSLYSMQWHSPSELLDRNTNAILSSLLSSLSLETSRAHDENGNSYYKGSFKLQDYSVIDYQILCENGVYYIQLLGAEPFVLPMNEMEGFLKNLRAYLISMGIVSEEDVEEFEEQLTLFYAQLSEEIANLQTKVSSTPELPASFAEIGSVFASWAETALASEIIEEQAVSFMGDPSVKREEYALTKEEVVSLLHALGKAGLENETFSSDLLSFLEEIQVSLSFEGEDVLTMDDLNEMYAALQTITPEDFPEDFTACYAIHQKQDSTSTFGSFELSAAQDDVLISLTMEISHSFRKPAMKLSFAFDDGINPVSFDFTFIQTPEKTVEEEGRTFTSSAFDVSVDVTLDGTVYPFTFNYSDSLSQGQTVAAKDVSAVLGMDLEGSHFEISAIYQDLISYAINHSGSKELTLGLTVADTIIPVISCRTSFSAISPEGCSFTAKDAVHPGTMSQAEFNAWMNSIVFEATERIFSLKMYLPDDLTALLNGETADFGNAYVYDEQTIEVETEETVETQKMDSAPVSTLPQGAEVFSFDEDSLISAKEDTSVEETSEKPKKNVFAGLHD